MRNRSCWGLVLAAALLVAAWQMFEREPAEVRAQAEPAAQPVDMPARGIALELVFGLTDKQATPWDGSIDVAGGKVLSGKSWKLATRQSPQKGKQKKKAAATIATVRTDVLLDAPADAQVSVTTAQGNFKFALSEVPLGKSKKFLDGRVEVSQVVYTRELVATTDDEDFPAAATSPDGTVWCAYTAYNRGTQVDTKAALSGQFESLIPRGNGDQLRLISYANEQWSAPLNVTERELDVWRPSVSVDKAGNVWVVWSQQVDGNWDVYCRVYDPAKKKWDEIERLTTDPGGDVSAVTAAQPESGIVVVWQHWNQGQADLYGTRLARNAARAKPVPIAGGPGNQWNASVATAANGDLWIAWDTYQNGNYDIYASRIPTLKPGETIDDADPRLKPIAVATSPLYEGRPSLVIDKDNRVWIAYEEGGASWGKDQGPRLTGAGVPFYYERKITVRAIVDGKLQQTLAAPESEKIYYHYDDTRYKGEYKERISLPRLGLDKDGRLWLEFRRHPLTSAAGERWVSFVTRYDGDHWAENLLVPNSANLLDNRPALLGLQNGGLLMIYSTDGRTANAGSAKVNDLRAALLRASAPAAAPKLQPADAAGPKLDIVDVHPHEKEQIQRIRDYRITAGGKTYRLLRGEFHRHTEISAHRDWDGPLEEVWRYGLDVADMDWIGPGDHNFGGFGQDYMWWLTQKQSDLYHQPGRFLTMYTYERSMRYPSGHRNVMFTRRGIRPLPVMPGAATFGTPEEGSPDIKNLYAYLKNFGGICSSHTSATNMGTDWRDHDSEVEPVVEIFQGHRQNYEETNAPLAAKNAQDTIQGYQPAGFVWQAFAKGHRLGFQCSSDHVSTHTSYGVVLAEENTRAGIVAAFKKRHSYGANDNIILDVRAGEAIMGDEITINAPPTLSVKVLATAPIERIDIVRQVGKQLPEYVYSTNPDGDTAEFQWTDQQATPGAVNMYYVRVLQKNQRMAWASPIWMHYKK